MSIGPGDIAPGPVPQGADAPRLDAPGAGTHGTGPHGFGPHGFGTGRTSVGALQNFYATRMGAMAVHAVGRRLDASWPELAGLNVLGCGYCSPFLVGLRAQAQFVAQWMPEAQGAETWPKRGAAATALSGEGDLPFADNCFDRVILCHVLEEAENPKRLLRAVWRVLAPEGRLIVIAANRSGVWSHFDHTPWGQGRSFTRGQLRALLSNALYAPLASAYALYAPPLEWSAVAKIAGAWECVGELLWPILGGVVLWEAVKRVEAPVSGFGVHARVGTAAIGRRPAPKNAARRRAGTKRDRRFFSDDNDPMKFEQ